ncbi:3'(2'),5'-bisphosphate nucleotidase CysQ [Sphingomonas sp. BN140010]|uniref:3'(2'),5'-bisphosphate nucleotidase CysQ n=1 Tax=Sphingomonas arvum TaxID=2992113 RepID=A0ABT3JHQ6_9SPHN|nr:3'(2'),5'-bisphosphate nucleotidase CysQ [Sphingomonas sp. BN140010]MCW3798600.1 3'(2'),5'-bisphosphate nucleotidase CysQ [Sphingomonas sp. BN140010]
MTNDQQLIQALSDAAREAGEAIRAVRRRGFDVAHKGDQSPVTEADHAAERIILAALAQAAPGVPVIAEEEVAAGRIPAHDDLYFLVDPLDGTKEFVRGGDDYTVNIGLIAGGAPRLGVVLAPEQERLFAGIVGEGAWIEGPGSQRSSIRTRERGVDLLAVASKSHFTQNTSDYLDSLCPGCGHVSVGSSLKFCIVAEGQADIYPRLSPTSEWDTAAGHAVLLAAGGRVDAPDGQPLRYGKRAFLNRGFLATAGWEAPPIAGFMGEFAGGGDLPQGV